MARLLSRRTFLGSGIYVGLSGCLGLKDSRSEVILDSIIIRNIDDSSHTVSIEIYKDDEPIIKKTVTADAKSSGLDSVPTISPDVPSSPAVYQLQVDIDGEDTTYEIKPDRIKDSSCIQVEIRITGENELSIWSAASSKCNEISETKEP
ncbi:hypothetical protein [Halorhabdus tiamatea]|uniref:hypothetical protein n=1 Tax=Halorhabdus tiamatea TaxID=430914 RepID=UPI0011D180BB|nr:hypothetical protein [Halorhabdus tiamatea]